MDTYENVFKRLIVETYKQSPEYAEELALKDEEEIKATVIQLDKDRVKNVRKVAFDDGRERASTKVRSGLERKIKQTFGFESDKTGDDLLDEVFNHVNSKANHPDISQEEFNGFPAVKQLKERHSKALSELQTKHEANVKEYDKRGIFTEVANEAVSILNGMKPILPDDSKKAANQKKRFLSVLTGYDYEKVAGKIVILQKNGSLLEDGHGNKIDFENFIRSQANESFEFVVAEHRTSPSGSHISTHTAQASPYVGRTPRNDAEYSEAMNKARSLTERRDIHQAYAKAKGWE
jgi:hypothetical protein